MKDKLLFEIIDGEINKCARNRHKNDVSLSRYKLDYDKYRDHIKIGERHTYKLMGKQEALEDLRTSLVAKGFFEDGRNETE